MDPKTDELREKRACALDGQRIHQQSQERTREGSRTGLSRLPNILDHSLDSKEFWLRHSSHLNVPRQRVLLGRGGMYKEACSAMREREGLCQSNTPLREHTFQDTDDSRDIIVQRPSGAPADEATSSELAASASK